MSAHFESTKGRPKPTAVSRAVLEKRLRMGKPAPPEAELITRRQHDGSVPLSFSQQQMWFLNQMEPGNPFYNVARAFLLRGHLDIAALEQSLAAITRRHEALRTAIAVVDGEAVQLITPADAFIPPVIELDDLSGEPEQSLRVEEWAILQARRRFDLTGGPMLRAGLLRLNRDRHVLLLVIHHIACDGWSLGVLFRELDVFYRSFCCKELPALPELPVQYADYAVWQRRRLQGDFLERVLTYWKKALRGPLPAIELPTDRRRPSVQRYCGKKYSAVLPEYLAEQMNRQRQEQGVTLFMLLLAAFKILLCRYTGQEDLAVGSPIANRNRSETEGLIGFFANTLVLRNNLGGNPTFSELLKRVAETTMEALDHQEMPFEKVVEAVQADRDSALTPLVQVLFGLQTDSAQLPKLHGLDLDPVAVDSGTAIFDLTLILESQPWTITATWQYNTDLFEADTIVRMSGHYQAVLESVLREPGVRIGCVGVLTKGERQQVVVEWNDTRTAYDRGKCVHELIEAEAASRPDGVAVIAEGVEISYGELNRCANQVGRYLRRRGVGVETVVGVMMDRSPELIVAMLGVMKSGGAYVGMDPAYPVGRLKYIVEDSGARAVLTEGSKGEWIEEMGAERICLEKVRETIEEESRKNPWSGVRAENLVYLIYTSGSTGNPKGVGIEHRSAVGLLEWGRDSYTAEERRGVLASTSICFDLSVFEIWGGLSWGGEVILVENAMEYPGQVCGERVSLINTVPSAMKELVRGERVRGGVKVVNVAGEALEEGLVDSILDGSRVERVMNLYGPTEDTTYSTWEELRRDHKEVTIGRPLRNRKVFILDEVLQPAPVGVRGEVFIGGEGQARCYYKRGDLTADRFTPDPFSRNGGERLYRTGDVARYGRDGRIEFLGRKDQQVKVRGYRIELGEVEVELRRQTGVKEGVVVVREGGDTTKELVGFVVTGEMGWKSVEEVKRGMRERLPEYMVPAGIEVLAELPLTPNGKVDRRSLAARKPARVEQPEEAGAWTATEELIAGIWAEVLGHEQIGVTENFFDIGGHSLKAMQVVTRLRKLFEVELPLRSFFERPTVHALGQTIDSLRRGESQKWPELTVRRVKEPFPLSFAQQRLWFLNQLDPANPAYNIPCAFRVSGRLNGAALEETLAEIVRRHEALRTRFAVGGGQRTQSITHFQFKLPVVDLSAISGAERDRECEKLARLEAHRPFDLTSGSLFRGSLLTLSEEEHILLLTLHHIASDGWSLSVLFREASALYEVFFSGAASPLPELQVQYSDYAAWQREWLGTGVLDAQLAYWKQQLGGAPQVLELPTDRPRPPVQSFRGASCTAALPDGLTNGLKRLARHENATLFMVLLAAFQSLLHRYTGQTSINVGVPVAGRNRVELEDLIGFFVNTLVLRGDFNEGQSFRSLVRRVREVVLEGQAHQDVPFEMVVEQLQPERDVSRAPLFQVMFAHQNGRSPKLVLPGLQVGEWVIESATEKFDLTLSAIEADGKLSVAFRYNTDLFERTTINRMAGHLEVMLEGVSADAGSSISQVPLLSSSELLQLLNEWNDTAADYPTNQCIHNLFEAQAEATPDAIAVICDYRRISYSELNKRANRLAHVLVAKGVVAERVVAILLERSEEMIISVLAVLKAGAAYLPLDPVYPTQRLTFMVEDSGTSIVLTREHLLDVPLGSKNNIIRLDDAYSVAGPDAEENPVCGVQPENLAYVIYTSGSTGNPKGVAIEHRSAVTFLQWATDCFGSGELEEVLASTSLCFDLSVFEMFAPLSCGGRMVIVENALSLAEACPTLGIKLINTVPSAMAELIRAKAVPASVVTVNLAGEPLHATLLDSIYHETDARRVLNLYGPTEDTTYSTWAEFNKGVRTPVTIGRPLVNTSLYVLDPRMEPVPIGINGELYLSGAGLARGYLNRADLTAARFVPNAKSAERGSRCYRTGDIGRYLTDGTVDYLGRIDHQVKIRGFRIELGEIEAELRRQSGVKEGVVVVLEAEDAKQLVAFVVKDEMVWKSVEEVKRGMRERLPEYMVPGGIEVVGVLPLTPNGKVDRRSLAVRKRVREEKSEDAATPMEELIAGIWAEVLGHDRVGVRDNFFEIGGHSLVASQVAARIRRALNIELALRTVFEAPTVRSLSARVERLRSPVKSEYVALAKVILEGYPPISYAQERLWFLDRLQPGSSVYNIAFALRIRGNLDLGTLAQSFDEVARRHDSLRTIFATIEGNAVQIILPVRPCELRGVDLTSLPDRDIEGQARRMMKEEARRAFDLERGPLFRVCLMRLAATEYMVSVTIHHIISDGWSIGVLIRELGVLHDAFTSGLPSSLPELPIQYADYSYWQRRLSSSTAVEEQKEYWKGRLSASPPLELPVDRQRPAQQTFQGATYLFLLPPNLLSDLKRLSSRQDATLYMTLLAAFQVLLFRYTGQEDISVGSPVAGRSRIEIEGLIGCFVNTLVMHIKLTRSLAFAELLSQVRDVVLDGYAHQEVPFEKLVEEIQPQRLMSHTPLFQVMFALQSTLAGQARLNGLAVAPEPVDTGTAKFDLTLALAERAGRLLASLEYNTDLFDPSTVMRMSGHYIAVLEEVVREPSVRISCARALREGERQQVLVEWNDTGTPYRSKCLHELIEAEAATRPDAVAIIGGSLEITYEELNRRANKLGNHLRRQGVGVESVVGVMMNRTADLIVAMLGVMKAGAAYVPMDPAYPLERLKYIVEHSRARAVLTEDGKDEWIDHLEAERISLHKVRQTIEDETLENPNSGVRPENLAYLIYTSGSTGDPKGVGIEHRSAVGLLDWGRERFTAEERRGVLASTSVCFDLSVFEIWGALSWGGEVILVENAMEFGELEAGRRVSLINTVPSAIRELVRAETIGEAVRVVNLAGEVLDGELVQSILEGTRVKRVLNLYGPTEDTTYSTCDEFRRGENEVKIGRPLRNTRVYILDDRLEPVALGVRGEVFIGGEGQARCYYKRGDLTADCFLPDPFSQHGGDRLYRTGDVARYGHDGRIEFIGRKDHQVKIRGYRIELGEVEAKLRRQTGVREAVVVVRDGPDRGMNLIGYVVKEDRDWTSIGQLKNGLRERLPEYMVPAGIELLAELPLTPNGKVDRRSLAARKPARVEQPEEAGAWTATEELIAGIWAEVLGHEQIGVTENFFDIGGHSLKAMQVVTRLRKLFEVELPLRSFFERPTVHALGQTIDSLRRGESQKWPELTARRVEEPFPLSFAQQRLWFLDQLDPANPAYNIPRAFRIEGQLDLSALRRSLEHVVLRHESLRTTFGVSSGRPVQVPGRPEDIQLPVIDLEDLPEAVREIEVTLLLAGGARRPFDLATGPLIRCALLRRSAGHHVFSLVLHHVISDGWSMGVLLRELAESYEAFSTDQAPSLPELFVQYVDYAQWQCELLGSEVFRNQIDYWKRQLGGIKQRTELPADRPRPPLQTFNGARNDLMLPKPLSDGVKRISRSENATPFMTMLAGFKALLYRYTGQEDIVVGTPVAGRNPMETEALIGPFINTLALRTDLSGRPSFKELLKRVRDVALGAYAHQDVSFERLVEELQPARDTSRTPLFQIMFILHNALPEVFRISGLKIRPISIDNGTAKFDLTLSIAETEGVHDGVAEYNTDLFDQITIARVLQSYQLLLAAATLNPNLPVSQLPVLSPAEYKQMIFDWNDTGTDYAAGSCLHQLFEARVAANPDAVSVTDDCLHLSYAGLNSRANQLAHHLAGKGIGIESLVAVMINRSADIAIALLGILKTGASYLPVDPSYPPERLAFMLDDAGVGLVVTVCDLVPALPVSHNDVVVLDMDREIFANENDQNPAILVQPDNLAYVIYTSGSTGKPKGVQISHASLANFLLSMQRRPGIADQDVLLALTTLSFDIAGMEFYLPLISGARVVIAGRETVSDGVLLSEEISTHCITMMQATPATWRLLVGAGWKGAEQMRLLCGGETLGRELAGLLIERGAELWNLYGPTETTIWSASHKQEDGGGDVPIGTPIANTQLYLLDTNLEPLPAGITGELYIGGSGLARGYRNCTDLTAERFIPDPFSQEPGSRIYKTGDLGRYLRDGRAEVLGRIDDQVKIRGFRIEPREIELALREFTAVGEAVVASRPDGSGSQRLIAYIVAADRQQVTTDRLRKFLRQRLPDYMVPSTFVMLERLPLTPNGKVDRRALPDPDGARPDLAVAFTAPRTPVETVISAIWAEVLGREGIGVLDDFFELGGHSLLAAQIISRVCETLATSVPLRCLFEEPTIAGLATAVLRDSGARHKIERTAGLILELAHLSEDQVRSLLHERSIPAARGGAE